MTQAGTDKLIWPPAIFCPDTPQPGGSALRPPLKQLGLPHIDRDITARVGEAE
jgi:hypothetical protein